MEDILHHPLSICAKQCVSGIARGARFPPSVAEFRGGFAVSG